MTQDARAARAHASLARASVGAGVVVRDARGVGGQGAGVTSSRRHARCHQQDGLPLAVQNAAGAPAMRGSGVTGLGGGGTILTAPHHEVWLCPALGTQGATAARISSAASSLSSLRSRASSAGRSWSSSHAANATTQPAATASSRTRALCSRSLVSTRTAAGRPAMGASRPAARAAAPSMILVATVCSFCSWDCAWRPYRGIRVNGRSAQSERGATKIFESPGGSARTPRSTRHARRARPKAQAARTIEAGGRRIIAARFPPAARTRPAAQRPP